MSPTSSSISKNVLYTVGSTGDYQSLEQAVSDVQAKFFIRNIGVVLELLDGEHALSQELLMNVPGLDLTIKGQNTFTKTIASIQGHTGTPGANSMAFGNWSITLNMGDVDNVAINDFVLISGCSGGVNPECLEGCFKVTAVDTVNDRITIASRQFGVWGNLPSGSVGTETCVVVKSRIATTNGGMILRGANLTLKDLIFDGGEVEVDCLVATHGAHVFCVGSVGAYGSHGYGFKALFNSSISGIGAVSGCIQGLLAQYSSSGSLRSANGCKWGILAHSNCHVELLNSVTGCYRGASASRCSILTINGCVISGCTDYGVNSYMASTGIVWQSILKNNKIAVLAQSRGMLACYGNLDSGGNTVLYRPTPNQISSLEKWAYIDTGV